MCILVSLFYVYREYLTFSEPGGGLLLQEFCVGTHVQYAKIGWSSALCFFLEILLKVTDAGKVLHVTAQEREKKVFPRVQTFYFPSSHARKGKTRI